MSQIPSIEFDVIIPARYGSTRLPGKILAEIAGKPLVCHTIDCARKSAAMTVTVATDDERIQQVVQDYGANCVMTDANHSSGTDRLAEAVTTLGLDDSRIVVNLQGDEPEMPAALIDEVASALHEDSSVGMSTAAVALTQWSQFVDPSCVKVLVDQFQHAIYFSRAPIPFPRNDADTQTVPHGCLRHVGLYAYRARYLRDFSQRGSCQLEHIEQLEQLRALHGAESIHVIVTDKAPPVGIDTVDDLEQARLRHQ